MNDDNKNLEVMRRRAERLQQSRSKKAASPLMGLSAFGVIGWSIAIPCVLGAFLGHWLNQVAPQAFSWTIALMLGGLVLGIGFAWNYISEAQQAAEQELQDSLNQQDNDNEL